VIGAGRLPVGNTVGYVEAATLSLCGAVLHLEVALFVAMRCSAELMALAGEIIKFLNLTARGRHSARHRLLGCGAPQIMRKRSVGALGIPWPD